MTTTAPVAPDDLRARALRRLKKKRDLQGHLLVYVLVNASIVVVWAMTSPGGFFWPVFPMAFWGIGVLMNVWDVYRNEEFDEQQVQEEMRRISR